jgi:hypothetical protein
VPSTAAEWETIIKVFEKRWNFPRCASALDGKHVTIQSPPNTGSYCFNYRDFHSTVLMALVDAEYKFIAVNIGCNGRISNGGVFSASGLPEFLEHQLCTVLPQNPLSRRHNPLLHIVADYAFPLRPYLIKPYPRSTENMNIATRVFNYRLCHARNVENTFGAMSAVFRVLRKPLLLPERVDHIVMAICCLRNYIMSNKSTKHPEKIFDRENTQTGITEPGNWRGEGMPDNMLPLGNAGCNNYSNEAKRIRDEFKEFFVTLRSEVPWQHSRPS